MELIIMNLDLIIMAVEVAMGNPNMFLAVLLPIVVLGFWIYKFLNKPANQQKEIIKVVLLQLVIEAEKRFGSNTGKVKFSYVYGEIIKRFGWLKFVPITVIEELIEEALVQMKEMLKSNEDVKKIVEGDK